jgi:predicted GNAT family acetyltransferase
MASGPPKTFSIMPADRDHLDELLDETIAETFPASDAPANTVATGIRVGDPTEFRVRDDREAKRFEIVVDGQIAFLEYERRADSLALVHTEVPEALRGRKLGELLARAGIRAARSAGLTPVAICPFVRAYVKRHPVDGAG